MIYLNNWSYYLELAQTVQLNYVKRSVMWRTKNEIFKMLFLCKELLKMRTRWRLFSPVTLSDINPVVFSTLKQKIATLIYLMNNLRMNLLYGLKIWTLNLCIRNRTKMIQQISTTHVKIVINFSEILTNYETICQITTRSHSDI